MAVMLVLLSIWARRWARKDSSGSSRSASASSARPASSGSVGGLTGWRPAWMAVTSSSARSAAERAVSSLIAITHPFSQRLEGPELQLLDRAFAPAHQRCDLGDGAVLAEAHGQHPALVDWQRPQLAKH